MLNFRNTQQVIAFHESTGRHFFSPSNMRFFSSRVHSEVYNGCYFVTSEKFDWRSPRLYTVRKIESNGDITTIGEFQQYDSRSKAHTAAKNK